MRSSDTWKLWVTGSGSLLRATESSEITFFSLAFNSYGGTLASGDFYGIVRLWNVNSGQLMRTLEGHQDVVRDLVLIRGAKRWQVRVMMER